MAIVVKETFNSYTDWVKTTDSAYKSSFESLSDQAKTSLNNLLDTKEIDANGDLNPDNVWVNLILDWSDKEYLVDILKFLTNDEYLRYEETDLIADYIKDKWDVIIDRLDDLGYIVLGYEKDELTILVN